MKPLFLYTPEFKADRLVLDRLRRAGYLPVEVAAFDCVKLVNPLPLATGSIVACAAFDALAALPYHSREGVTDFGRRVALALGTPQQPIPPATAGGEG